MKPIVIAPHSLFLPVVKQMVADIGKELPIYALHPAFAKNLQDIDIAAKSLGDVVDQEVRARSFQEAARVLSTVRRPRAGPDGLDEGALAFLENGLAGFLYPRLGDLALLALSLDKVQPGLILLHNDVEPMMRLAALWARAHGVPCLHVPHAIYLDNPGRGPAGTDVHDLISASYLAAAGPYQRGWYEERGAVPDNIRETGLPQYDKWAMIKFGHEQARAILKAERLRPLIVYASSWRQDTNLLGCHDGVEESYRAFLQAACSIGGAQFLVKTHPNGRNDDWHLEQAKAAGISCMVTSMHLEVVLAAADVVVAYGPSNLLMEAASIPGLRLLCIGGFADDPEVLSIPEEADQSKQTQLLAQAIGKALSGQQPNTLNFRLKYMGVPDGQAYLRVAKFVGELWASSSP